MPTNTLLLVPLSISFVVGILKWWHPPSILINIQCAVAKNLHPLHSLCVVVQGIYELNFRRASLIHLRVRCPRCHVNHLIRILSALDMDEQQHYAQHQTNAPDNDVGDAQEWILATQQRRRGQDHLFRALKVHNGVFWNANVKVSF